MAASQIQSWISSRAWLACFAGIINIAQIGIAQPARAQAQQEQKQTRIAVLEFSDPSKSLDANILAQLSDEARRAAADLLPKSSYTLMTRESQDTVLRAMDIDLSKCDLANACEVDLLRTVAADFGLTGNVSKIGNTRIVTLKLFDTSTGNLLGSERVQADNDLQLLDAVYEKSKTIFAKNLPAPDTHSQANPPTNPPTNPNLPANLSANPIFIPTVLLGSGVVFGVGGYLYDQFLPSSQDNTLDVFDFVPVVMYGAAVASVITGALM